MPEQKSSLRARSFSFIGYPESLPNDWEAILDAQNLQYAISPLHDKDVNADGEPKKPHYHVALYFRGKKSLKQVEDLLEPLNVPKPQFVADLRGLIRYFAHMDNPEKHQYPVSQIRTHGGLDIGPYLKVTSLSRNELIAEMMDYCRQNCVTSFAAFCDVARRDHYDTWFSLLTDSSTYVMKEYIRGLHVERFGPARPSSAPESRVAPGPCRCDPNTGEVIE